MSERITAGRMQLDEQAPKLYAAVYSHTTLYHFLRRLDERGALVAALNETIRRLPKLDPHEQEPAAILAVDATGLAPGAISTFYVRRTHKCGGEPMLWRRWLKWLVVVDTDRQMVLAQEACSRALTTARRCCDHSWTLPTRLLRQGVVLADAEFDSEHNYHHVHERLAAASVIPAKRGKATWHVQGYRAKMRVASPRQLYRRRALVESVFSPVKRKLSARAPGRRLRMQRRQALLLGLAYNLYRLRACPV